MNECRMADEEKAEEYSKGKAHEHYNFLFEENSGSPVDFAKLCYLDGLTEGRKEEDEKLFNNWCKGETPEPQECPFLQKLEKENAELKAQIEKMKNVGNCKHSMKCAKWNEKQLNLGLMKFCLNCKDWELAE